jgi:hypothetical protein
MERGFNPMDPELYLMPRNLSIKARILARLGRTRESNTLYQKSADLSDALLAHVPTADVERELITSMQQVYAATSIHFAHRIPTIRTGRWKDVRPIPIEECLNLTVGSPDRCG